MCTLLFGQMTKDRDIVYAQALPFLAPVWKPRHFANETESLYSVQFHQQKMSNLNIYQEYNCVNKLEISVNRNGPKYAWVTKLAQNLYLILGMQ